MSKKAEPFTDQSSAPRSQHARNVAHTAAVSIGFGALAMGASLPATAAATPNVAAPVAGPILAAAVPPPEPDGMRLPVPGKFKASNPFGTPGYLWSSGYHTGLDLTTKAGTPVLAADDGTVVHAGWEGAYGKSVVIRHADGLKTRYAHLESIAVKVGASVTMGQPIGRVGSTGNSTGPHLHFEVMLRGKLVDPEKYLAEPVVRSRPKPPDRRR